MVVVFTYLGANEYSLGIASTVEWAGGSQWQAAGKHTDH